jgi:NAD(P)-dependent dehydrogenase (short-subunit alcohol dehydrogenase family)
MNTFIVGGSRGVGLALAEHYLAKGDTVAILARSIPVQLRGRFHFFEGDIAEPAMLQKAIQGFVDGKLDRLIVCAGIYYANRDVRLTAGQTLEMLRTNLSGLNHAFEAASALWLAQPIPLAGKQLVVISSIAALLDQDPRASLYAASKRCAIATASTYRKALAPFGARVTCVIPGYIDTQRLRDLNQGDVSRKPGIVSLDQAVALISEGIEQGRMEIVFPRGLAFFARLLNVMPAWLQRSLRR